MSENELQADECVDFHVKVTQHTVTVKRRAITHWKRTLSSRATIKEVINSSVIPGHPVEAVYARRL